MPFARKHPQTLVDSAAERSLNQKLKDVNFLLSGNSPSLEFPEMLESNFREEASAIRAKNFIIIGIFGIFVYNSFLFTDYFVIHDQFYYDIIVHAVFTPIMIYVILRVTFGYLKPESGMLFCMILVVTSIVIFLVRSQSEYSGFLIFTVPLAICFGNLVLPLPFRESIWFTGFSVLISSVGIFLRQDWQSALTPFAIMINAGTGSYMLFATYRAESTERRAYLFNLRERLRADVLSSSLAQQQAVLQSILDTGPDAMLLFDTTGKISSFSPAAEQLFGWTAEAVVGRNISSLMAEGSHVVYARHFKDYFELGERRIISNSAELKGLRMDGSTFPMMLHVGEVLIGSKRQFTGIIHDLTSLQEAHDRSQDLRTQLAHVWSMNSLGEMAAILAHELNQPLSAITNYMRGARTILAHEAHPDDDVLEALDQASAQALRAGEIIRRMRSLIAHTDNDHRKESIRALISEIDFMVRLVAREADVTVRYNLSKATDFVYVDRIQIQQVVSNLVRNASEAMQGHADRILEISTRREGDNWVVAIEDSGPGIAPEMMEKLFVPLATSKAKGMGLGLTVSRAIINHHKGELWVATSRLGGASFGFTLPRYEEGQTMKKAELT